MLHSFFKNEVESFTGVAEGEGEEELERPQTEKQGAELPHSLSSAYNEINTFSYNLIAQDYITASAIEQ